MIGSDRTVGRPYGEGVRWMLDGETPADRARDARQAAAGRTFDSPLIFSALPNEAADPREMELAVAGHVVCTNASTYRMVEDVPLLLPEVNADHLGLIDVQRANAAGRPARWSPIRTARRCRA